MKRSTEGTKKNDISKVIKLVLQKMSLDSFPSSDILLITDDLQDITLAILLISPVVQQRNL